VTVEATVVVVTWQGRHLLAPCLDALAAQTLGADRFNVVVVDNASTDATADLLAARPDVRVVTAPRNLGFAGGATLGLATVTTPYAVVLNNDARPEPDWLEQLLAGFGPGIAAVTSKVLLEPRYVLLGVDARLQDVRRVKVDNEDVTTTVVARQTATELELAVPAPDGMQVDIDVEGAHGNLLHRSVSASAPRVDVLNSTGGERTATGHGADRGYLEIDHGQYDDRRDVFAICGAAAAVRTDLGAAAGWFDPWLFAYYEDLDLSWRLRRAGWQVRYMPTARVRHRHAATSGVGSDLFLFHNRRNRLAVLARNAAPRELVAAAAAVRRPRPTLPAELLVPGDGAISLATPTRGKGAALLSFALRLPRLLIDRATRRVPPPTTADVPGSGPRAAAR
jgi:GT2 family glycosyltransferase